MVEGSYQRGRPHVNSQPRGATVCEIRRLNPFSDLGRKYFLCSLASLFDSSVAEEDRLRSLDDDRAAA